MAKVKKKDVITSWGNESLVDVRNQYNHMSKVKENEEWSIDQKIKKINELDKAEKNYLGKLKYLVDGLKTTISDLEYTTEYISVLQPILDKKQAEDIQQKNYQKYIERNKVNVQPLIDAVELKLQKFIDDGCCVLVPVGKDWKKVQISEAEARRIHEDLLAETICIIMDKVGDITQVCNIQYNNNRGFDCKVYGTKRNYMINTIMAGGWNIQELHYRTLAYEI